IDDIASRRSRRRGVNGVMAGGEPNGMPADPTDSPAEIARHSTISVVISNHLRSSGFPPVLDEPRQVAVERDRAAIAHPGRTQPHDGASQHLTADAGAIGSRFHL